MDDLKWPGVALLITLALIAFEWHVSSKKKGGVNTVDHHRMFGMLGIGFAMAAMVWGATQLL